jgi:hypothetical protein
VHLFGFYYKNFIVILILIININMIIKITTTTTNSGGPLMLAQWLRYCATNRKVAGSIPDGVIGLFH